MPQDRPPLTEQELITYFEGALDAPARQEIENRLPHDPAAQALLEDWAQQNEDIRRLFPAGSDPVPERLTEALRVRTARPAFAPWLRVAAMAGLLLLGGGAGWLSHAQFAPVAQMRPMAQAALAAHATYVVEVAHPVEVRASEREHLDTWMSRRIGAHVSPPDLATSGFVLMGGRILPADTGTAGLYMYENAEGQRITLYVSRQTDPEDSAFRFASAGETQGLHWNENGIGYVVVGDLPRDELKSLGTSAYEQLL